MFRHDTTQTSAQAGTIDDEARGWHAIMPVHGPDTHWHYAETASVLRAVGPVRTNAWFWPAFKGVLYTRYVYIQNLAQDCHFFFRFRGLSAGCWRAVGSTVQKHVRSSRLFWLNTFTATPAGYS